MINFKNIPKFVINLDRRPERLVRAMSEFNKFNLDVVRWPAIDGEEIKLHEYSKKTNQYNAKAIFGCMKSHYNLINNALNNEYEYICVFEDDVILSEDFLNRIEYIQGIDFDMMYLGGQFDKFGVDVFAEKTKYIFKCNNVGGTYAYIMKNTVFDYVIQNMNYQWGADEFFAERLQKIFDCKAFIPFMVGHIDGYSDVAMHESKTPNVFKNTQLKKIL